MYGGKTTLYGILGVSRDSGLDEVRRAYQRFKTEQQDETIPPDPRRDALVEEAWSILSDPQRREAYDRSLRDPAVREQSATRGLQPLHVAAAAAALLVAALAFLLLRPKPVASLPARSSQELAHEATAAVARLSAIDISGHTTPLGLAFTVGDGILATSCRDVSPGVELSLHVVPRHVPAKVMDVEPSGLCRLSASGAGSWPLAFAAVEGRRGDKVFGTRVNAVGESSMVEGTIREASERAGHTIYETTITPGADARGGPLLDAAGRVLAIATPIEGDRLVFVSIPRHWTRPPELPRAAQPPPPAAPQAAPETTAPPVATPAVPASPQRQQRLEKAFRPPPTVPGDI